MNIRTKLLFQFTLAVVFIISLFSFVILYFSIDYRADDYYSRLESRALNTAQLLFNVDEITPELLKIIDKNSLLLYKENMRIYNEENVLLYSNLGDPTIKPRKGLVDEIKQKRKVLYRHGEREGVGLLIANKGKDYILLVSALDKYGLSKIRNLKIVLLVGFIISVITTLFFGYIFAGRALQPISNVINQVNNISISNISNRLDEGNKKDEIARLSVTFNQMLERIENAFVLQSDFVANAAHELRTPFAVMVTELDFILMQERENDNYKQVICSVSSQLKKLSELSNNLLDLARMSFEKSVSEFKILRIDELLTEVCQIAILDRQQVKLDLILDELPEDENKLKILGSSNLIAICIHNLIDNACKFSNNQIVTIKLKISEKHVNISVIDRGIGIYDKDARKIFEPFYRGINTHYISGHGIGLALTKKIVDLHSGTITFNSQINNGSEFHIFIPHLG